jgi:hypothetical protein
MAGPITLEAGSYPVAADGLQGFRELTALQIREQIAGVITQKFATDTDGSGTAELNVVTGGSAGSDEIGTFSDRARTESVGTHPAAGTLTTTTFRFNQPVASVSESGQIRPLRWTNTSVDEMTDGEIDSDILDEVIQAMATESANTVGQYKIDTSTPSGGTWTARYTIPDTQTDGTTINYYLWQKTAPTTDAGSDTNMLLQTDVDGNIDEMADADVETLVPAFRNRIIASGVGTYLLQTGSPTATGTWAQMGGTMTDQVKDIVSENYSGEYAGSYVGYYDRIFNGFLEGAYAGTYSGTYYGEYAGNTIQTSSSTQETKQLFIRTA